LRGTIQRTINSVDHKQADRACVCVSETEGDITASQNSIVHLEEITKGVQKAYIFLEHILKREDKYLWNTAYPSCFVGTVSWEPHVIQPGPDRLTSA
jgi:hypothetical protein